VQKPLFPSKTILFSLFLAKQAIPKGINTMINKPKRHNFENTEPSPSICARTMHTKEKQNNKPERTKQAIPQIK
jgi:hypothetical protein